MGFRRLDKQLPSVKRWSGPDVVTASLKSRTALLHPQRGSSLPQTLAALYKGKAHTHTHHTNHVCVHLPVEMLISHTHLSLYRFHPWARCTCRGCTDVPLEGAGDHGSPDPQFKKTLLGWAAPPRLPFSVLGRRERSGIQSWSSDLVTIFLH